MNKINYKVEAGDDGTKIIALDSDDEFGRPQSPQQQRNYSEPMDSSVQNEFQFKTEKDSDSEHQDTMNPAHEYMGGVLPTLFDEIGVPYPFNPLSKQVVTATSAAPPTPALISTPLPITIPNSNIHSQLNIQNRASQAAHAEVCQMPADVIAQFIESRVKQQMQDTMNEIKRKFHLVPKRKNDASLKSKVQKPSHNHHQHHDHQHKSDKKVAERERGHGHGLRPSRKLKLTRRSRSKSVHEFIRPSTSTSKRSGKFKKKSTLFPSKFSFR